MSGNGIYSTLEVAGSEIVEKFIVVPPEESPVKSKMAGSSREANLPQVDYNKSLPELVQSRDEDLPEALLGQRSHAKPWTLECAASDITENEKTIWGLKRRRFYMVVVVVLFVAVAIAIGGGIGGTIWRNGSRGNIPADPSVKVHSSSKLAAANWTDPLGTEYYAVFWQASSADLMVSLWCSTSNWTVSNISTSVSVSAINGTPLAAAARGYPYTSLSLGGFGVTLFYLSPEHTVEQLYTTDFELGNWTKGTLSEAGVKWTANPSSQLAVWWSLCGTGCTGNLRVLYQDDQQTLRSLNSSNWGNATSVKAELGVGAGITITGLTVNYDQTWEGHSTQRLYYHDAGMVQEVGWGDEGNAEDVISGSTISLGASVSSPLLSAAAFSRDLGQGRRYILLTAIRTDGTLRVTYFNNGQWTSVDTPTLAGAPSTVFSAGTVVTGKDLIFYGLTREGNIQSFAVDISSPLSWTFCETVVSG